MNAWMIPRVVMVCIDDDDNDDDDDDRRKKGKKEGREGERGDGIISKRIVYTVMGE
jgi:hypothetical protein